ncbi:hypothetical protein [Microbacterium lacticum]
MAVAPALQIVRMFRRNSSDDVSVGYFTLFGSAHSGWGEALGRGVTG